MAIQGIGPNSAIPAAPLTPATADALKTAPQKLADARAEANAGVNDGDEATTLASKVNTHA